MTFAEESTTKVEKQPEKVQATPANDPWPMTFAMTGYIALSIELIKSTGKQVIVSS